MNVHPGDRILANSVDWWMNTNSPNAMFPEVMPDAVLAARLRESTGVDSAILAAELGVNERVLRTYQRRLGLRACAATCKPRPAPRRR